MGGVSSVCSSCWNHPDCGRAKNGVVPPGRSRCAPCRGTSPPPRATIPCKLHRQQTAPQACVGGAHGSLVHRLSGEKFRRTGPVTQPCISSPAAGRLLRNETWELPEEAVNVAGGCEAVLTFTAESVPQDESAGVQSKVAPPTFCEPGAPSCPGVLSTGPRQQGGPVSAASTAACSGQVKTRRPQEVTLLSKGHPATHQHIWISDAAFWTLGSEPLKNMVQLCSLMACPCRFSRVLSCNKLTSKNAFYETLEMKHVLSSAESIRCSQELCSIGEYLALARCPLVQEVFPCSADIQPRFDLKVKLEGEGIHRVSQVSEVISR
ncbi:uncharacterized protein [Equus przewalskii]|uniref:Uncharacterized protein isoform X3 n=1 Tax=Equus przewalskii TaxID=9798 RepID=A0ABM4PAD9_EQUPR